MDAEPLATVKERGGHLYQVFAQEECLELRSNDYSTLKIEPADLLHEITADGILRVSSGRIIFGLALTTEALDTLRSLARGRALLPRLSGDLIRSRPSTLAR